MAIGRRKSRSSPESISVKRRPSSFRRPIALQSSCQGPTAGNAWGYWLDTFNNQILLEDPNGSVGTSEYVGPYWLETDETEQVELVLSVPPVPSHSHISTNLFLSGPPMPRRRYLRRHQRIIFNC